MKGEKVSKIESFVKEYLDDISFVWPEVLICKYTSHSSKEGQRLNYALYLLRNNKCPIARIGEIDFYPKKGIVKVNSCHGNERVLTLEESYRQDLEKKLQDFLDEQSKT